MQSREQRQGRGALAADGDGVSERGGSRGREREAVDGYGRSRAARRACGREMQRSEGGDREEVLAAGIDRGGRGSHRERREWDPRDGARERDGEASVCLGAFG